MRAIGYATTGPDRGDLRAVRLADPDPGPGEVRVRIVVAGVNPTDVKARRGGTQPMPWPFQVPGQDGAGVIDRVGPGVDPARVGERVWVLLGAHGHPGGTAAEYVCLPEHRVGSLGQRGAFDVGAGLGVPGLTAHHVVLVDGDVRDRTVLVTGGGGAVGHAAVQIARHAGARVVTTVGGSEREVLARTADPHVVLRYRDADFRERLAAAVPDGIDRVIDVDFVANVGTYHDLLNPDAVIVNYASTAPSSEMTLPSRSLRARNCVLRFVLLYGVPVERLVLGRDALSALVEADRWVPMPSIRYPLEQLEEAHAHVMRGALGKVLVDIGDA